MFPSLFSVDFKTLILFTVLIFFKGIFLIGVFRIRHQLFLKWLGYGCLFFALGWLLFSLRFQYGISFFTLPAANILILLLPVFLVRAVFLLLKIQYSRLYLIATLFLLIFTLLFLIWSMHDRWIPGIYTSTLNGLIYIVPGILLIRFYHRKNNVILTIILLNFLTGSMLLIRSFLLLMGCLYPDFMSDPIRMQLLNSTLFLNIVCLDAQILCFPILDFMQAQKDLTEANQQLKELSNIDELTGLLNRRALNTRLNCEISTYKTNKHRINKVPFSIILFDLDHFKKVNDSFGHPMGDVVLKQTAKLVGQLVRSSDTVMRYGGEEFMIMLPNTDAVEACKTAERLRVGISQLCFVHPDLPSSFQVTASFGVAVLSEDLLSESALLKRADQALYQAKTQGRNQVCI